VTLLLSGLFGKAFGFSGRGQRRRSAWIGRLAVAAAAVFARPSRGIERPRTRPPRHRCVRIAATLALVFMIAPLLVVVPLGFSSAPFLEFPPPGYSLRWYSNFLSRSDWLIPTWISFKVATITAGISTFLGVLAAIGLTRSRARLAGPLMAFLMSPLTLPHLIIAVGLYFQLAALGLVSTITGLVIGHTVLALPLVTIVIINALRTVDAAPETAACSLGAPPARAFLSTTLLALAPSVGSAALFAFLASFDDIIMALFLSGTSSPTLPKRMWEGIVIEIDPTVAAVSTLLVLLSAVLFLAAQGAVGLSRARRRGASSEIVEPARVI
jgi:ABC-type spermidine/putrescine transport system permease subunit II